LSRNVENYQSTLHNIPGGQISHLNRSGGLKKRKKIIKTTENDDGDDSDCKNNNKKEAEVIL
jgi:hypothetical protein